MQPVSRGPRIARRTRVTRPQYNNDVCKGVVYAYEAYEAK